MRTHQGFTLLDIFLAEEKLAIEVRKVNGVEVKKCDMTKTGHNHVLHWILYRKEGVNAEAMINKRQMNPQDTGLVE